MPQFVLIVIGVTIAITGVAIIADLAGFPPSGAGIGGAIGGAIAATMIARSGVKICPRCSAALPRFRRPTSLKQAFWGGWSCQKCGCEIGPKGQILGPDTARP
jgi:hypothetical protein